MTTTVRLLATYDGNPPQTIVRLPDALAASFVAAGNASLNLTGGINVPPPAVTHVVGGGARLIYSAAGALLGIGDSNGNLILNSSGATTPVGATVPGAPTSLALTAAAGAVIGAFTPSATTGGDPVQWFELELSNGTRVRGDASPIAAAAPAGAAVTAVVRAVNGVGPSAASNTSNSVTPTGAAVATAITLSGPTTVVQNVATANYTVALSPNGGTVAAPVTVTPTPVAGVTFAPTSLTLTTASPSGTFTATATTTGTKSIAVTNDGGLANPGAISLVVSASEQFVDVVIFAGQSQSNSNGTSSTGNDVPAAVQGAQTNAFTWDPFNNVWLTYEAGVNSSIHLEGGKYPLAGAKYHGMEAEYLRRWREQNPGVPIYMIKKGHSTTSIDQAARSANRGCWDPTLTGANSDLFEELVNWVTAAYANIRASGKTPRLRAINWIQGENEADNSVAANRYQATLEAFITAVRSRVVENSTAPFVISRIQSATWQFPAVVRAAQVAVAANAANNARWFDADSATLAADMVHYNPAGCVALGRICYEANLSPAEIMARYISRMTVAPSGARQTALSTLFAALTAKSVWPTITAMQLYASHDQQSALANAAYAAPASTPTNETFVADRGFTGSGTGSHIDTGYIPSSTDLRYRQLSNSQSLWIRTNDLVTTGIDLGAFTGGVTLMSVVVPTSTIRVNAATNTGNTVTLTKTNGLTTVARFGTNDSRLYQDGAQVGAVATPAADTLPTVSFWVGDRNGGSSAPTQRQYATFLAGSARTDQQEADLYAALNSYLTGIGAA